LLTSTRYSHHQEPSQHHPRGRGQTGHHVRTPSECVTIGLAHDSLSLSYRWKMCAVGLSCTIDRMCAVCLSHRGGNALTKSYSVVVSSTCEATSVAMHSQIALNVVIRYNRTILRTWDAKLVKQSGHLPHATCPQASQASGLRWHNDNHL
jgi:hypothetical protein